MSLPIVLRSVAQDEADEAAHWYEAKQAGLGADFLAELQRVLDVISRQAQWYPVVLGETRETPLARFLSCVSYRERPARVVVTAVFHTCRDPSI